METGQGYGVWLHGEAVSAGMLMAARMSEKLGWIEPSITERARKLLADAKLPLQPPAGMSAQQFRDLMAVDKKVLDGKLRLILLKGELGGCVVTGDFDPKALDETLDEFCTEKSSERRERSHWSDSSPPPPPPLPASAPHLPTAASPPLYFPLFTFAVSISL
eukprot:CAMPEP_0177757604 /NCGR_PEP_ID=MMETSP0491_2-20121128/3732_1 /TAXON_ID=63592 /ORGANISM="Tetraselmis chuii, Strain PLY429" /LENGTH=161 /DNA_ID=CAMNT_0019273267 /DNA_START=523 /DNA_END=1009 /DNA_ORIENTATION=+